MGSPALFLEQQSALRGREKQAHKDALSDTELEANIGDANDNITGFRKKLSELAPGSAEHEQAKQGLTQALQARTQLFHPANNPTAMQKFGHMLLDHMQGKQPAAPVNAPTVSATPAMQLPSQVPPTNGQGASSFTLPAGAGPTLPQGPAVSVQGPQTPQQLKAQAEANLIASSAPAPPVGALTPEETHQAALIHAGIDPRATAPKAPTAASAKAVSWLTDSEGKSHPFELVDGKFQPVEGAEGMAPPVKAAPHSNAALQMFLRTEYGDNPTAAEMEEGIRKFKQLQTPDTSGSHEAVVYDRDGNAHVIQEHSSSHKSFGGGGGSSRPTGGSKASSGAASAGKLLPGIGKNTPAQSKAQTDLVAATKLKATADDAWSHPSAVKDKNLALAIIRGAAGRVNMQEYNILTKQAGLGNSLEAWANKVTTGQLPLNIRKQLVDLVHSTYAASGEAKDAAFAPSTPGELKSKAKDNTQPKNAKDPLGIF